MGKHSIEWLHHADGVCYCSGGPGISIFYVFGKGAWSILLISSFGMDILGLNCSKSVNVILFWIFGEMRLCSSA